MELKESFFLRILCVKSWSVLKKIIFDVNLLVVNGQQVKELSVWRGKNICKPLVRHFSKLILYTPGVVMIGPTIRD